MADFDLTSLHALEIKTLRGFTQAPEATQSDADLEASSGREAGQLRRAVEWLVSKSLLAVASEEARISVSLSDQGKRFLEVGGTPESELLRRATEGSVLSLIHI